MDYIRVSEILGRLQDFSGIDEGVLENKAKIGTNVHQAIVEDTIGDFPILKCDRAAAYFGSYEIWKKKENPRFKIQVPRLYDNDLMITGEIDGLIETTRFNLPVLIDWKCSASANEDIWNMQAHFYLYLLKQNNIDVCKDKMIWINLRAKKAYVDGGPEGKSIKYYPLAPKIYEFSYNDQVLSRCVDEAIKAWEEKKASLMFD
jgi:PD-(D/E)XK nuclease superfamily protein